MALFTLPPDDNLRFRRVIGELDGWKSLLALSTNESGIVVEMALQVLGNLVCGDTDTKASVIVGSRMCKAFTDNLERRSGVPGIVQQSCRLLANLWAEAPVPEVVYAGVHTHMLPDLRPGAWVLLEFTNRGEMLKSLDIKMEFTEEFGSSDVEVKGTGHETQGDGELDFFRIEGSVDGRTGAWSLRRRLLQVQQTIEYTGQSDLHGACGVYRAQRSAGPAALFLVSTALQPRCFRLYRVKSDSDDEDE